MKNNNLHRLLTELELISNEAVIFLDEKDKWNVVSTETKKKLSKIKPDAVYVHSNIPFILFFDLTDCSDFNREKEIHKQVWSFDQAPLMFVIKNEEIKIYNAFAYERNIKQHAGKLEEIPIDPNAVSDIFSFWNLESSRTWTILQEQYINSKGKNEYKKRVNQRLFDNIKYVREHIATELSDNFANTLILRLIFIRYLIDRNVQIDPEYISGNSIVEKRISFSQLIKDSAKLNAFFGELNRIFNGVLFKENIVISSNQASFLSDVFNEKENIRNATLFDDTPDFYFDIFDFNIIPVELISGIYESLITDETRNADSAFYTPLFLVEHILSQTVDKFLDEKRSECKVFDASVGSGIFLVQTFRRMVEREIILTGELHLSKKRLSEIATKNLWGIDTNREALKVAKFSIYIAILEYEEPGSIMDQFHFGDLNLYEADFFELDQNHVLNTTIKNQQYDFILGNPPWKKDKSPKHLNWINENNIYGKKVKGEMEISQDFLLRVREFSNEKTICSLIVSSPIFYNISSTSKKFKEQFLTSVDVISIFDLSPVRHYIFEGRKTEIDETTGKKKSKTISNPALVITFKKTAGNYRESLIEHTSVKSNIFTKLYKVLVVEKFDRKRIKQHFFIDNSWMFKLALYGNALDYLLLRRIGLENKIIDAIKKLPKGAGILKGGYEYEEYNAIIDKPVLENEDILPYYTTKKNAEKLKTKDCHIKSGRITNLYQGNQILIKEQAKDESDLVISYTNDYVFRKGIFGISSKDTNDINKTYAYLISDIYTYYIFISSCAWGVSTRPQIRFKEEFLSFPYIEVKNKEILIKLVDNFLSPLKEHYSKDLPMGEPPINFEAKKGINQIINEAYGIKENGYEKDIIDYVLNVSRYQFQESKQDRITRKASNNETILSDYVNVFFLELESIYSDEYIVAEIYNLNHFIAINFVFTEQKPDNKIVWINDATDEKQILEKIVKTSSVSKISKEIFIQKDVKGFEENSFYIIKPNEYKCWHRAMAWYDVSEIKSMIEDDEINLLNELANV
ncbi:MAG: DNA methyltransferase [Paludibacter sp.]